MSIYLLESPEQGDSTLSARVGQLIDLFPIRWDLLTRRVVGGDIIFVTGELLESISLFDHGTLLESILSRRANLCVLPPLPQDGLNWNLPHMEKVIFQAAGFGPVWISDELLRDVVAFSEVNILYNVVIRSGPGRLLAITNQGKSVLTAYQHRSNWGMVVYTTLLLTSTSTRSPRAQRAAFLQGLITWLQSLSPARLPLEKVEQVDQGHLAYELSILLLALCLFGKDEQITLETLQSKVEWIQEQLQDIRPDFRMEAGINQLASLKVLSATDNKLWIVEPEILDREIEQRRLWNYLRRLRS